jgi:hypothetical protein
MTSFQVAARSLPPQRARRWVRQRRVAAQGRVSIGTIYSVGLAVLMACALLGQPALAVIWPADAGIGDQGPAGVAALVALTLPGLFVALRQVGPLVVGRGDATWLLPAPVPRRTLLAPALVSVAAVAAVTGALAGLTLIGHLAARPVSATTMAMAMSACVVAGLAVALAAVWCQRRPAVARFADLAAAVGAGGCLLLATVALAIPPGASWQGWPYPTSAIATGIGLLLAAAAGGFLRTWRRLDTWPTHQIAEASAMTAAYTDAIYTAEPSFLADLREQRFWRRRAGFRSVRLRAFGPIPIVVVHDLLIVRRKAGRLAWLTATTVLPALFAPGPTWLLIGVFLAGALSAAGLTMDSVRSDARHPALRRLLGLSGRSMLRHRVVVPSLLAAVWCLLALTWLAATDGVPAGPWWALGIAVGPAVAAAALQRARAKPPDTDALIDTPLGAFPAGMLLWFLSGLGVLAVLAFPVILSLATRQSGMPAGWLVVLVQTIGSGLGTYLYLRHTPLPDHDA